MNEQQGRPDLEKLDEAQMRELVPQLLHKIAHLEQQVAHYTRMLFGKKSEKTRYLDPNGLLPFPEFAQLRGQVQAAEQKAETVEIPAHTRQKTQRRSEFPEHLPRQTTECTLDDAQRKFKDALLGGDELAKPAMEWTRQIFAIERQARESGIRDPVALRALRQEKTRPILEDLKRWIDLKLIEQAGLPRSPLMDAVGYVNNQWKTLERFVEDGSIRDITNNGCERSLRSVVIGRKNWLWFGSEDGARRSALLMSLVQSCRELGVNPLLYLRDVLRAVSTTPASEVHRLTPRGWKRAHGSGFSVAAATPAAFVPVS